MNDVSVTKTGLSALIAVISYLSGRFNDLFWILCMLMLMDYATGYISAWVSKTKNSRIGLIGIFKKIMYIIFVIFGFILDIAVVRTLELLNISFSFSDIGGISLGVIIMVFYIGNETISIVENFEKMGLKIPRWLNNVGTLLREAPAAILRPIIKKGEEYIEEHDHEQDQNDDESDNNDNEDNTDENN